MGLVVVGDFRIVGILTIPAEAEPELVVDTDAMLAFSVSLECLEVVARWEAEFVQLRSGFQLSEFPEGDLEGRGREFRGRMPEPELFSRLVGEGLNHAGSGKPAGGRYSCQT